ncbi:Subtilisin-like protease [Platanthera zijinensis]|uniref:Subtilisin-like protease n=1 Tax=Platanthera zijinensis TaxID=2320716 RepID=A0AAP0GF65_9ASPA
MSGFLGLGLLPLLLSLLLSAGANGKEEEKENVYIVYMGGIPLLTSEISIEESHSRVLASINPRIGGQRANKSLIHQYKHGFSGFAARFSKDEADAIRLKEGVVSVFVDPIYELHTTRSWDFLQETSVETDSGRAAVAASFPLSGGSDTIVGLLDTGIWPESESFRDSGLGPIPSRWKGICMKGSDFSSSNCNKKLIGARFYNLEEPDPTDSPRDEGSPRDDLGHGTHTSSTAAGIPVMDASFYGLADGTATGGSASSRIAMYKVCGSDGCPGSAILSAFDDAIADGVDLLSISLGASSILRPDFDADPIAIGAFHAVAKGITVVCSAGNDGPKAGSVVNAAPWILTVGATTIDRYFESDVVLGGNRKAVKGDAINFSKLKKSASYPLIYGASARLNSSSDDASASHCDLDSLDGTKIKGRIALCKHFENDSSKILKIDELKTMGAIGTIFVDDMERLVASSYISFPVTEVTTEGAKEILEYIDSTENPVATILPTITVKKYKPAPEVAYFSSRGPTLQTSNILKPDIGAPGVNILASWTQNNDSIVTPSGEKVSHFNLLSGTSMACPHVAGIAAKIKSWNPSWSPAAIRSAIMTTGTQKNNENVPITTDSGSAATPYDIGAGEINPTGVLNPGLVYEIDAKDYLQFLCNYGYTTDTITKITAIPSGFECSKNSSKDLISNLNYPSIALSNFTAKETRVVTRAAKNVGDTETATYVADIKSPKELSVKVVPDKLQFSESAKIVSYQVFFSASSTQLKGEYFGSITWSDETHRVRSPFVVKTAD